MNNNSDKESYNINSNLAPNQRQRTMLLPIDNLLTNHYMMISTTKVLIKSLMNNNIFTINLTQ